MFNTQESGGPDILRMVESVRFWKQNAKIDLRPAEVADSATFEESLHDLAESGTISVERIFELIGQDANPVHINMVKRVLLRSKHQPDFARWIDAVYQGYSQALFSERTVIPAAFMLDWLDETFRSDSFYNPAALPVGH